MNSPKQTLIDQLMSAAGHALPYSPLIDIAKTLPQTAAQNKWNLGQFGKNAATDAGNVVSGLASMVHSIPQDIMHPQQIAPDVTNAVKGIGSSLNNAFGQPVNPQSGKLQEPNYSEAEQNFYNQPINAALNYSMVGGALGKLAKGGKAVGAAEAGRPAGWQSEGMKAQGLPPIGSEQSLAGKTIGEMQQAHQAPDLTAYENAINSGDMKTAQALGQKYPGDTRFQIHQSMQKTPYKLPEVNPEMTDLEKQAQDLIKQHKGTPGAMNLVKKTPQELQAGKIANAPANVKETFLNQFDVPTKIAFRKLNMDRMANTVLSDNVNPNFNSLQKAANTVTGGDGELPQMIGRALDDNNVSVDLNSIMQKAGDRLNKIPELAASDKILNGHLAKTTAIFNHLGDNLNKVSGANAYDIMQRLEDESRDLAQKNNYLTSNVDYKEMGQAYYDTAQDIQDALDEKLKGVDMQKYETPQMRQNLAQNVSPQFLQRYDQTPKTIDNLRSLQKPYYDLSEAMRYTKASAQSVWTKAAKTMSRAIPAALGAGAGSPLGPVGMGAGALIGNNVFGPVLDPLIEGYMQNHLPAINMGIAKAVSGMGKMGLPSLGGVGGKLAPLGALAENAAKGNPTQTNPQQTVPLPGSPGSSGSGVIPNNTAPVKYSDIPQDVTKLQPNAQGQYAITSPMNITDKNGQPIAVSEDAYKNQKAQLQAMQGSLQVKYNPKLSAEIDSQLKQLETAHDLSGKAQSGYNEAMKASNAVTSTQQTLANAPVNLFNKNQTIQKLNSDFNGKYAALAQQLQILQKYYPVMVDSVLKAPDTGYAKQILSQISNQIAQDYYQGINGLTGNVPGQETAQSAAPMQSRQSNYLPPLNGASLNNGNGGSVQGQSLASF